jgi:glutamate racemase
LKVGLFDSGLGGLTVLNAIAKTLKGADIFYVADTLYAPYGDKSKEEIFARCDKITRYLLEKYSIDALVVACNTATSIIIKHLRQNFPNLIIIGIEPGIKPAINKTKTGNIGILATASTLNGEKYRILVDELTKEHDVKLFEQACVGLVQQIEKGETKALQTYSMLENWLKPMLHNRVDTIVLGCTHYPLVKQTIKDIMGEDIILIDTGDAIAKRLMDLSQNAGHINEGDLDILVLYTGDIKSDMVKIILKKSKYKIRKCEI